MISRGSGRLEGALGQDVGDRALLHAQADVVGDFDADEVLAELADHAGDEVITNGGVGGVVRELGVHFISVEVADNVRIRVQKGAIANVLPKGTLKSA